MSKRVTVTVSLNTNPQVEGRYFIDLRDTTHVSDPLRARQMTTRITSAAGAATFIDQVRDEARRHGVSVTVKDETSELSL